jgi:hypothetical protein
MGAGFATAFAVALLVTHFGGIVLSKQSFKLSMWLSVYKQSYEEASYHPPLS